MATIIEEDFVVRNLKGTDVFEFGCSPGKFTDRIKVDYNVTAIDLYDPEYKDGYKFIKGDILDSDIDDKFDSVVCLSSLEHCGIESLNYLPGNKEDLSTLTPIVKKLTSLIKEGGRLVITAPFGDSNIYYVDKDGNNGTADEIELPAWGFRTFRLEEILNMFKDLTPKLFEIYGNVGGDYFDPAYWVPISARDYVLYDNKHRGIICCVLKKETKEMDVTYEGGYKRNLFGDGISWENHVDEIVGVIENPYYGASGAGTFEDAKDYIKTDTPLEERKALDCGCHIGRFIEAVRAYGFDYTGVDQSAKALEAAKKAKPDGTWVESLLWDLPFKEEFDFAFTNAVLQHNKLAEQEKIVPKIYDSLKPGGVFLITESTEPATTETQRTHKGWIDMVESFGFKLIKTSHINPKGLEDKYIFLKEK